MKVVFLALFLSMGPHLLAQGQRRSPAPSQPSVPHDSLLTAWSVQEDRVVALPIPSSTTVSVNELRIPGAATKEFRLAQRYFQSGNLADSARHFEKAIEIYAQNPAAYHNLGVCYTRLNQYEMAAQEFQKASLLDPYLVQSVVMLSDSLFRLGRYSEAEAAARHALGVDPLNRKAAYLLGRSLAAKNQNTAEAVELLRQSRADFPLAKVVLGVVLLKRNSRDEAVAELRGYLQQPDAPLKDEVRCMLERLTLPPDKTVCSKSIF
jgi:tetratricopeptide (TPR) repeat protein